MMGNGKCRFKCKELSFLGEIGFCLLLPSVAEGDKDGLEKEDTGMVLKCSYGAMRPKHEGAKEAGTHDVPKRARNARNTRKRQEA